MDLAVSVPEFTYLHYVIIPFKSHIAKRINANVNKLFAVAIRTDTQVLSISKQLLK